MSRPPLFVMSTVILAGWLLAAGTGDVTAGMASPGPLPDALPPAGAGLLHRADTFAECQKIRWCGRSRYGRYRCRLVERCRECRYVRRCGGPPGCRWTEVCRWEPYKPPLPTN